VTYEMIASCEELVELTTEYFERNLDPPSRLRYERHLAACPSCRGFVTQLRKAMVVAGSVPSEPLSDDAKAALLEAFRAWRVGR
jgi:anti-sigma factor RsiW